MNAAEKLTTLVEYIKAGRTVHINTGPRHLAINLRTFTKFEAIGRPVLKADAKSIYICTGKRYYCIDSCKINIA